MNLSPSNVCFVKFVALPATGSIFYKSEDTRLNDGGIAGLRTGTTQLNGFVDGFCEFEGVGLPYAHGFSSFGQFGKEGTGAFEGASGCFGDVDNACKGGFEGFPFTGDEFDAGCQVVVGIGGIENTGRHPAQYPVPRPCRQPVG